MGKHARDMSVRKRFSCFKRTAESKMRGRRKTSECGAFAIEPARSVAVLFLWKYIVRSSRPSLEDCQTYWELTPGLAAPDKRPPARMVPHLPAPNILGPRLRREDMTTAPHDLERRSRYRANDLGHEERLL
jgi:hypothetical protein